MRVVSCNSKTKALTEKLLYQNDYLIHPNTLRPEHSKSSKKNHLTT